MKIVLTKEDIIDLRGAVPDRCDFCSQLTAIAFLEPEEAGQWVCHTCLRRWAIEDQQRQQHHE